MRPSEWLEIRFQAVSWQTCNLVGYRIFFSNGPLFAGDNRFSTSSLVGSSIEVEQFKRRCEAYLWICTEEGL